MPLNFLGVGWYIEHIYVTALTHFVSHVPASGLPPAFKLLWLPLFLRGETAGKKAQHAGLAAQRIPPERGVLKKQKAVRIRGRGIRKQFFLWVAPEGGSMENCRRTSSGRQGKRRRQELSVWFSSCMYCFGKIWSNIVAREGKELGRRGIFPVFPAGDRYYFVPKVYLMPASTLIRDSSWSIPPVAVE